MPQSLWRQPDFLKLWTGQAISQIGSRVTREGLPLTAVLILGASPLQMGILNGASAAAVLAFGLFAGAWVDRLRRRPLLIASDLASAALLGLIPIAALLHRLTILHLYLVAAAAGIAAILFDVAYQAYILSLVSRDALLEANSKIALNTSIAEVSGPALTGVLVQWLTAPIAVAFDAASFLISAASLAWIRTPEPDPPPVPAPHILHEIREGLLTCWHSPLLRALVLRTATGAFFVGFQSLYILYAIRDLRLNAAMLGFIIATGGASNLLGALLSPRLVRRFGLGPTLIATGVMLGVASLIPPLARGTPLICCVYLVAGQLGDAAWPVTNICDVSLRQSVAPARLLGRVNSAMNLLFRGVYPAGALAGGALATLIGVRATMAIGGAGFLLSTLFLFFSPVRSLRD